MEIARRDALVTWSGTIAGGDGRVRLGGGAGGDGLPLNWDSRSEQAEAETSPEELLAAAEASCYAQMLSLLLTRNGTPPERLQVRGICSLQKEDADPEFVIDTIVLEAEAVVPGLDDDAFGAIAERAERGCPTANAVRGNADVRVSARLASAEVRG